MLFYAMKKYSPVRVTVLFFLTSLYLLASPFFNLSDGINYLNLIISILVILIFVFKLDGLILYRIYGELIKKSNNFEEFDSYNSQFVQIKTFKQITFFTYWISFWVILEIIFGN